LAVRRDQPGPRSHGDDIGFDGLCRHGGGGVQQVLGGVFDVWRQADGGHACQQGVEPGVVELGEYRFVLGRLHQVFLFTGRAASGATAIARAAARRPGSMRDEKKGGGGRRAQSCAA